MKLNAQVDASALASLGVEAVQLLSSGNIRALVDRFGYARALGRELMTAVQEDLQRCLTEIGATSFASEHPVPRVTYFEQNSPGLLAVIECLALTQNGSRLLVELVVSGNDAEKHVTLEDLSVAA
jgi:hypothetical protein